MKTISAASSHSIHQDCRAQEVLQEEGRFGEVPEEGGHRRERGCHHLSTLQIGRGEDHTAIHSDRGRESGLWPPWRPDLQGGTGSISRLHHLLSGCPRQERRSLLEDGEAGEIRRPADAGDGQGLWQEQGGSHLQDGQLSQLGRTIRECQEVGGGMGEGGEGQARSRESNQAATADQLGSRECSPQGEVERTGEREGRLCSTDEHSVMGMRWLLTWKVAPEEPGGRKAKARAIILGYQDPNYEHRETSAPTPSKAGRQLFLQLCSWRRFRLMKADVSGAFLQGDDVEEELWCRPVAEICAEMGVSEGTPMLLRKAAYGLVQAPLQWYKSVCNKMKSMGYYRLITEPCCWILQDETGQVCSIIHAHVDDFMIGGAGELHEKKMEELKQAYKWGAWEEGSFEQCGITVTQHEDGSIGLKQERFIEEIEEITLSRDRARHGDLPTSNAEKGWLRGALGSLSWLCGQTCFMYSADVGFLISTIPVSTVDTINKTNLLIRQVKKWKHLEYRIHPFHPDSELTMVCWADAAWANRPNGKDSTEGIFIGMSDEKFLKGHERDVTPIYWRSSKISRVCRSPACAETQASVDGEDDLLYLRVLWFEMIGGELNPRFPNEAASQIPAALITDSTNLYDKIHRPAVVIKGAEKRSDIECISLRENIADNDTPLFWAHGGAMLANSLTKPHEKHQAMNYVNMNFRFKVIFDEERRSEKVRRKHGMNPLEDERVE